MKVKAYVFAISFCCALPFMAQGADVDEENPPPPPPKAPLKAPNSSVAVETGSGMLMLYLKADLGNVNVCLQDEAGNVVSQQSVDTSVQNQILIAVPAGVYFLTITDSAGNVKTQESVLIP